MESERLRPKKYIYIQKLSSSRQDTAKAMRDSIDYPLFNIESTPLTKDCALDTPTT